MKALGRGIGFGVERITCHPCSRWSPDAVTMGTRVTVDGQSLDGWAVEESFIDSRVRGRGTRSEGGEMEGVEGEGGSEGRGERKGEMKGMRSGR